MKIDSLYPLPNFLGQGYLSTLDSTDDLYLRLRARAARMRRRMESTQTLGSIVAHQYVMSFSDSHVGNCKKKCGSVLIMVLIYKMVVQGMLRTYDVK